MTTFSPLNVSWKRTMHTKIVCLQVKMVFTTVAGECAHECCLLRRARKIPHRRRRIARLSIPSTRSGL